MNLAAKSSFLLIFLQGGAKMKKFKADSQRVLKLMVDSIYTNKEIFLRELISNASDALEKAKFASLTDSSIDGEFFIEIKINKDQRSITISDTGIGMDEKELETNLGTIAESGTEKFKAENLTEEQLIGQFGVGFYSSFMVAKKVIVRTKRQDKDAYTWISDGTGYEITPAEKQDRGTEITLFLKENTDEFNYEEFLEPSTIQRLVKKYSDYIRFPIYSEVEELTEDGNDVELKRKVINSMVPIWKKGKEATKEELDTFYQQRYYALNPPLKAIPIYVEGSITYHALLFFPSKVPFDFYSVQYERGLSLYSNGVMIMENCKELLPDYLGFVRGVVDSDDLSLNISREMLQKTRQLEMIAKSIEKKILSAMERMLKEERENYEKLFSEVGAAFKFGIYRDFGLKKDELKDLCLFYSSKSKKLVTLKEYVERLSSGEDILYAAGETKEAILRQPIVQAFIEKDKDILLLTDRIDEFVIKIINEYEGHKIKSVSDKDVTLGEKSDDENIEKENKDLLDKLKNLLGDKVSKVGISSKLPESSASFLTSANEISLEMEKLFNQANKDNKIKAERLLEINPKHKLFEKLKNFENQEDKLKNLATVLYYQAAMLANIQLEDPEEFVRAINDFITK